MIPLKQYIGFQTWDGHNNLIGGDQRTVCRCNVCSVNPDTQSSHYQLISDYINTKYNPRTDILLASGQNPTDLKQSMSLKQCKGIGEIFVWKQISEDSNPISNYSLLDIVKDDPRPLYIHWDMTSEDQWQKFEKFLQEREGPVVLCHLGVNSIFKNQRSTIIRFGKLQKQYDNLWGEISWDALDWLYKYPDNVKYLNSERIFTASDLTHLDNRDKRELQMMALFPYVKSTKNIKKLFNKK